jgi:ribonuclease HI
VTYEDALNIYTDGSSLQRPRRGGVGIRYIVINEVGDEECVDECPPGYKEGTNNEMELLAPILALRGIPDEMMTSSIDRIYVFTDSMYVRDHFYRATHVWPANGWCNRHGRPIENVKLWKDLVREVKKAPKRVEFRWVKGHGTNKHNKAVDKLAKQSANSAILNDPLTVQSVRRKLTNESVEVGSVKMEGQALDIRIITDKWMREQKVWRYKYEVLPSDSPYSGKVDLIFSKLEFQLRAHHSYKVVVCDDQTNPRILELIDEILKEDGEE